MRNAQGQIVCNVSTTAGGAAACPGCQPVNLFGRGGGSNATPLGYDYVVGFEPGPHTLEEMIAADEAEAARESADAPEVPAAPAAPVVYPPDTRWFNGRPVRPARTLQLPRQQPVWRLEASLAPPRVP